MSKCDFTVRTAKVYGKPQYSYAIPVIVRDGNVSPMHKGEKISWCYVEEAPLSYDANTGILTIGTQSVSLLGGTTSTYNPTTLVDAARIFGGADVVDPLATATLLDCTGETYHLYPTAAATHDKPISVCGVVVGYGV